MDMDTWIHLQLKCYGSTKNETSTRNDTQWKQQPWTSKVSNSANTTGSTEVASCHFRAPFKNPNELRSGSLLWKQTICNQWAKKGKKKKTSWYTIQSSGPAFKVVYPRLSAHTKCCPPRDRTSGPRFRLGEICRAEGFCWPAGRACSMASADVRLYLFLFHLSMGTCPLHPRTSLAQPHYCGLPSVFVFFSSHWGEGLRKAAKAWNFYANLECGMSFFSILLLEYKIKKGYPGPWWKLSNLSNVLYFWN